MSELEDRECYAPVRVTTGALLSSCLVHQLVSLVTLQVFYHQFVAEALLTAKAHVLAVGL